MYFIVCSSLILVSIFQVQLFDFLVVSQDFLIRIMQVRTATTSRLSPHVQSFENPPFWFPPFFHVPPLPPLTVDHILEKRYL